MWWFIGLILLAVSIPLLLARFGLFIGPAVASFIGDTFFDGEDIFAEDFRYAREVTWLQWPALGVGILEELPASGLVHFLELAVPVGIYAITVWKGTKKPAV